MEQNTHREYYDKEANRDMPVILSVIILITSIITRVIVTASDPLHESIWLTRIAFLITDVIFTAAALYLLFVLGLYLCRKAIAKPKPHTYPGFKGFILSFAISAIILPAVVFTAVAITNDDQEPIAEFSPPPTPTAVPLPTEALDPQEDLAQYRDRLSDDSTLNTFLTCWNRIGQDEGIRRRIDARDHLRVQPLGEGFWVDIRSDASQESEHILQLYGSTQTHFERYLEAYDQLIEAIRAQDFPLASDEVLLDQQVTALLWTEPFTDEQWLAIRDPAYNELTTVEAYQTDMTTLMEILIPGCSHN